MTFAIIRTWLACSMGALACLGCGGTYDASLTGKVTYGGQPLTTGAVTFQPVGDGPVAIGSIQPDGSFIAVTGDEPGIAAGDYIVTVVATGPAPEPTPDNPEPLPSSLIPAKYSDLATSGLKLTVKPGSNLYDIPLE